MDTTTAAIPLSLTICIVFVVSGLWFKTYKEKHNQNAWCHESAISAIFGLIVGFIIKISFGRAVVFDSELFFYLVLPPIIFSAGYSLKRKRFFRYGLSITVFGIFGTVLSVMMTTLAAHSFCDIFKADERLRLDWPQSMLLASILSASDEVSAMSMVRMKDYPRLGALIFGEGVLNDVLSIVLFKSILSVIRKGSGRSHHHHHTTITTTDGTEDEESPAQFLEVATMISITVLVQFIASLLIGLFCGLTCSRFLKTFSQSRRHPVHQTALVLLFGLLSYSMAEFFGVSGILTLFVAAVTLAHYSWHSLSKSSQISTKISFLAMSDIAEGFAFAYVGLSMWQYTSDYVSILFSVYMLITIILVRVITIMGICLFCKKLHKDFDLPVREQLAFCLGGLVRGCLCWAQVLQVSDQSLMVTTTLFIVLFTTICSGFFFPIIMPVLVVTDHKTAFDKLSTIDNSYNSHNNNNMNNNATSSSPLSGTDSTAYGTASTIPSSAENAYNGYNNNSYNSGYNDTQQHMSGYRRRAIQKSVNTDGGDSVQTTLMTLASIPHQYTHNNSNNNRYSNNNSNSYNNNGNNNNNNNNSSNNYNNNYNNNNNNNGNNNISNNSNNSSNNNSSNNSNYATTNNYPFTANLEETYLNTQRNSATNNNSSNNNSNSTYNNSDNMNQADGTAAITTTTTATSTITTTTTSTTTNNNSNNSNNNNNNNSNNNNNNDNNNDNFIASITTDQPHERNIHSTTSSSASTIPATAAGVLVAVPTSCNDTMIVPISIQTDKDPNFSLSPPPPSPPAMPLHYMPTQQYQQSLKTPINFRMSRVSGTAIVASTGDSTTAEATAAADSGVSDIDIDEHEHDFNYSEQHDEPEPEQHVPLYTVLFILWVRFDERVMKPLFGGSSVTDGARLQILQASENLHRTGLCSMTSPMTATATTQSPTTTAANAAGGVYDNHNLYGFRNSSSSSSGGGSPRVIGRSSSSSRSPRSSSSGIAHNMIHSLSPHRQWERQHNSYRGAHHYGVQSGNYSHGYRQIASSSVSVISNGSQNGDDDDDDDGNDNNDDNDDNDNGNDNNDDDKNEEDDDNIHDVHDLDASPIKQLMSAIAEVEEENDDDVYDDNLYEDSFVEAIAAEDAAAEEEQQQAALLAAAERGSERGSGGGVSRRGRNRINGSRSSNISHSSNIRRSLDGRKLS